MSLEDHMLEKISKGIAMAKQVEDTIKGFDPVTTAFNIGFKFDLYSEYKGKILVITGNKEKPAGLSISQADYVVVEDFHTAYVLPMATIKEFIRSNFRTLEKSIDDEYEHIGVLIPVERIEAISQYKILI